MQPELGFRTIELADDGWSVRILDQTVLPHRVNAVLLTTLEDAASAIADMQVRGAPLIGGTAAYGMALAMRRDPGDAMLEQAEKCLLATRPTAVNLHWAVAEMVSALTPLTPSDRRAAAYQRAAEIVRDDERMCAEIGRHGADLFKTMAERKRGEGPLNVLTHCNAGALATCGLGTATAPIYRAHADGVPLHVWVDETRPRNQGAALTTWELAQAGVPHTLIVDNAGGHLMQHGRVDLCIVGSDRTTGAGDVCNKIGTYLKALAAADNGVPFYAALPSTTIDWTIADGVAEVPIEERSPDEVTRVAGLTADGELTRLVVPPIGTPALNIAFDVTPRRLVAGLITERGIAEASPEGLAKLFPDLGRF